MPLWIDVIMLYLKEYLKRKCAYNFITAGFRLFPSYISFAKPIPLLNIAAYFDNTISVALNI